MMAKIQKKKEKAERRAVWVVSYYILSVVVGDGGRDRGSQEKERRDARYDEAARRGTKTKRGGRGIVHSILCVIVIGESFERSRRGETERRGASV